ncbi:MAG TPA: glycosyltransferase family 1 protein [Dehalococcoidia bacterium]|nr:glycosyltransferase family 1 protein [Dehalococcoidia bacterium]
MASRALIAFDCSSVPPQPAGAGMYTLNLLRALARIDAGHDYLVYARSHTLPLLGGLPANFKVRDIGPRSRWGRLLWEQTLLPLDLRRRGARLMHSPHHTTPLLWCPCPRAVTVHDVTFFILPERYPLARRLYFQALTMAAARRARAVIVPSASVADEASSFLGLPRARIAVTHEGIDSAFKPLDREECQRLAAERYHLPEGYILSLGTREPGKNREAILWAMRYLVDLGHSPHLAVVGQPAWGAAQEEGLVARLGLSEHVHFTGYVPQEDLPALYNAASVFVFPSLYEGFGLPVLEAMACGTPVITSNVSALPEVADGAAILVDPRDARAIADAIELVWSDPEERRRLCEAGRGRAAAFTWDACAERTLAVYRRLLGEEAP